MTVILSETSFYWLSYKLWKSLFLEFKSFCCKNLPKLLPSLHTVLALLIQISNSESKHSKHIAKDIYSDDIFHSNFHEML